MTDTHVVSALKEKRIQVASQIESLQGQLRQAVIDLDHVEAALRLFAPNVDMAALSPCKVAPVLYDTKGDTGRISQPAPLRSPRPQSVRHRTSGSPDRRQDSAKKHARDPAILALYIFAPSDGAKIINRAGLPFIQAQNATSG